MSFFAVKKFEKKRGLGQKSEEVDATRTDAVNEP